MTLIRKPETVIMFFRLSTAVENLSSLTKRISKNLDVKVISIQKRLYATLLMNLSTLRHTLMGTAICQNMTAKEKSCNFSHGLKLTGKQIKNEKGIAKRKSRIIGRQF